MSNEVTIYDAEMLRLLGGMVKKDDGGGNLTGPPTLKVNYDPDSIHERGCWVVGQKKAQDGSITEEGEVAKGLIILLARNRWSYYNQKDTTKNCSSPPYLRGAVVRGSNYGYVCGKQCPMRADGIQPRCKAQIVLYGLAVSAEGRLIECVSYQSGDSYMVTQTYLESIEKIKVKGGYVQIPLFASLTLLDVVRKQNEGTKYFQSMFKQGSFFKDRDQLVGFQAKRDEVLQYIERMTSTPAEPVDERPAQGATPPPVQPAMAAFPGPTSMPPTPMAQPAVLRDDPTVPDFAKSVGSVPWEAKDDAVDVPASDVTTTPTQANDDGFNLIDAINKLIT